MLYMYRWGGFLILCFVIMAGCRSEEDAGVSMTKTEKLRLQLSPDVGAFMAEGEVAFQKGNYNLAFALMDSVEAIVPDLADLHFMRGRIFTRLNDLDLSQTSYERVIALDPEYRGVRYNMGLNASRRGLLRQAVDLFLEEEAVNPEPLPLLYLELGKTYAKLGEPDSARTAYETAIDMDPNYATAYMWLGQLLEEIGDLDEALDYSKKGAALKPEDPDYQYIIGTLYYRKGELEEAVQYLEPIADEMRWHQGAQYNLGQSLMRLGREDEAQAYLAQADSAQKRQQAINEAVNGINTDPGNRDRWVHLATLQWETGQLDRAVESYNNAINIDPANFGLQSNFARMLIESGQFEAGVERYQRILRLRPEMYEVWNNLGAAYANHGAYEEARAVWERVLEMNPSNTPAKAFLQQLEEIERDAGS